MSTTDRSRREFLRAATAVGGGLILGGGLLGCGERDAAAGTATAAAKDPTPRHGGRLRFGIIDGDLSGNLDAHKPAGIGSTIRGFAIYSKLWEWSEEMTPRLALAEEAETNADATTWTIRLRKGLEFHNGKTITADDVIFSTLRLTDPELASPYRHLVSGIDRSRIEKLDERTVRINMKEGHGFLPLADAWVNFGGIVPPDYHPVINPVGAGPYRIKDFKPGQRALLTRFENYYKPSKPYTDELEIIEFKDQTSRYAALVGGQVDLVYGLAPEQTALFRNNPRASLQVSEAHRWQGFSLNLKKTPFDDVRVRQAFRLIADREELIRRVLNGQGRLANDLYSPRDPTFLATLPQRHQDLDRAKALLREAGHERLSLELVASAAGSAAAVAFAEQARRAGVELKIRQVDLATFNGPQMRDWQISTYEGMGESYLSTAARTDGPISASNRTNFSDERFDELFRTAVQRTDVQARVPLAHEMQQIQHERGGLLIWAYSNVLDGVSPRVGGISPEHSHFSTWRFENFWLRDAQPATTA
ncbi:peptide/nickel transport system substrate-binding protein [Panacagrimonas perspica]|uniref:Peptide/nickel transport system substrate-binding protein n=1 Tax=Panacagrimonas perspica TaxID=381431 RepID=A0A4R7PCG6_9GAMM|nr:ABC transporter substrate-binding protein [Panacagrimonas perspica]TDU31717.1 peptide/nickel transport system substrate-binding protein [Panacagrimonas perspica]THD03069.1 ABC transporter substrate-binding protein [Panacagrimonas perspica]